MLYSLSDAHKALRFVFRLYLNVLLLITDVERILSLAKTVTD